jgi:nucleotide-binding universal stress UspA family protein
MKSVLLYANEDTGLESRLQAALDAVRIAEGHLLCLQVTPFDSFIMGDPFGGVYALPMLMDKVREADDEHRARLEQRLKGEGVSWDWLHFDGQPAQMVVDRSRLSDLIVLSLPTEGVPNDGPLSMTADVAIHARTPVLAVPQASRGFDCLGSALVAWNGSQESCNALRLTVPLLQKASEVHVVTVTEDTAEFPATYACLYLARHGIEAALHEWPRDGRSTADALIDAANSLGASYVLMGAYGHSRFREAVLGGATRDMLLRSPVPLLLAH